MVYIRTTTTFTARRQDRLGYDTLVNKDLTGNLYKSKRAKADQWHVVDFQRSWTTDQCGLNTGTRMRRSRASLPVGKWRYSGCKTNGRRRSNHKVRWQVYTEETTASTTRYTILRYRFLKKETGLLSHYNMGRVVSIRGRRS